MRDLAPEAVYKYACEDADVTLKLKQVLGNELETNGVKKAVRRDRNAFGAGIGLHGKKRSTY